MSMEIFQDIYRYRDNGRIVFSEPSLFYLILFRIFSQGRENIWMKPLLIILSPFYMFLSLLFGIYIPRTSRIGKGFRIHHFGGIVINPGSVIGENCTIRHCVTIGNKIEGGGCPKVGNNVTIGVGAKILGNIEIGDNVEIGANAVVVKNIPSNCICGGVPAKIIKIK